MVGSYKVILVILTVLSSTCQIACLKQLSKPTLSLTDLKCKRYDCGIRATEKEEGTALHSKSLPSLLGSILMATQMTFLWPSSSSAVVSAASVAPAALPSPIASEHRDLKIVDTTSPPPKTTAATKVLSPFSPTDLSGRIQRLEDTFFRKDDAIALERRLSDNITRVSEIVILLFVVGFIFSYVNTIRMEGNMEKERIRVEGKMEKERIENIKRMELMEAKIEERRKGDVLRMNLGLLAAFLSPLVPSILGALTKH